MLPLTGGKNWISESAIGEVRNICTFYGDMMWTSSLYPFVIGMACTDPYPRLGVGITAEDI